MKKIVKEYEVFSFDELDQKAKDRARRDYIESDELEWLPDDMQYKAEELVKEAGIEGDVGRVYYSLTYCQGDGAMFEGKFYWKGYSIVVKHRGHYYHYNSKDINTIDEQGNDIDGQVYEDFNTLYVDICQKLAEYGYDCIETSQSEENLKEHFEANDYNFLADGKMVNY
jgi:hypothetical protein